MKITNTDGRIYSILVEDEKIMTMLERLLAHDAWTTRQLLLRCKELSEEQISRRFDIGDKDLRETFHHVIAVMETYADFLRGPDTSRTLPQRNGALTGC